MKNLKSFSEISEKNWDKKIEDNATGALKEGHNDTDNYMFFANVMNIHRMCQSILEMDPMQVDAILQDGHGWATDHIATSKDDVEEVYNFLYADSQTKHDKEVEIEGDEEGMISDGENC